MSCPADVWSGDDFLRAFRTRLVEERTPINCSIDLTRRCNLTCAHCYVRHNDATDELNTGEIQHILRQAADMGSLYLLLTGGEPLLRKDFAEIYASAKDAGFFITIFTNGTLLNKEHLELFQDLPPWAIEISLYGASPETYERVTGVPGSYNRCMAAIDALAETDVNLRLKTVMMTLNQHELPAMRALATRHGARFHFDAAVFPTIEGDPFPLAYRANPVKAVQQELSDPSEREHWIEAVLAGGTGAISEKLFLCGAGVTGFHVTSNGLMQPCMVSTDVGYSIRTGNIQAGWEQITSYVDRTLAPELLPCRGCAMKNVCGYCPGTMKLETGGYDRKIDFSCEVGALRWQELLKDPRIRKQYGNQQKQSA